VRASNGASPEAFSLIEVAVSVGVIAVCLLAVIGLLPAGLSSQQAGREEARAASALSMASSAAESLHSTGANGGNPTWAFPLYFSDDATTARTVYVSQADWELTLFVDEAGLIVPSNDTSTPKRQTLHVVVHPPAIAGEAVRIYAAVAWPYKPTDTAATGLNDLKGRAGFVDTFIAYLPKLVH
jgi:uncharacterized protein (TIGR02598 family)